MAKANLQASDDNLFPLMDKVQEFLVSDRQVMLILGKSTFNKHLELLLLQSYTRGRGIPLFINLPAIDRPDKELIAEQLRTYNFSEAQIQEMKEHRHFILICDGYDESQLDINLHKTNRLNQQGQWCAKMVISCRSQFLGPEYFSRFVPQPTDRYSSARLNLFQEAVIAPFSKKQVEDYVARYVPLEPRPWVTEDYMRMLTAIPNLMDLVKNPFLLTLSLEALPKVIKDQQDLSAVKVTRVQLYDCFVDQWFGVNMRRLQDSTLSKDDREMLGHLIDAGFASKGIGYSRDLAVTIFGQQAGNPVVRYIHLDDSNTWKKEFFGPQVKARLLRESSPMTRTGNFHRFLHRSMLEYFLSLAVFEPTGHIHNQELPPHPDSDSSRVHSSAIRGPLSTRRLITEPSIIQFLCERVKQHPDFEKQLLAVIE
ncbi:hypothetical protein BGZ70_000292 [Mortierella alpina]|uniref:Uncharacterized protein n=1 Tax=Mortierella alpina TaxID=64518 RepID=A0A9P6JCS1_MORAP|nr:hypothetical protein BGZ70_000292 [Mortierella alpina]